MIYHYREFHEIKTIGVFVLLTFVEFQNFDTDNPSRECISLE